MSICHCFTKKSISHAVIAAGFFMNSAAWAQDISDEHLNAAREAIKALIVTQSFDDILPNTAQRQKQVLIQANPNFSDEISLTVDEEAIKLAGRRADLETEAATIYARKFSQEELIEIANFYSSETGKNLIKFSPNLSRELVRAAEIWAGGIARDLDAETGKALREKLAKPAENTEN